jgi:hypothetical protein
MSSGLFSNGNALENIFAAWASGMPHAPATGLGNATLDINQLFAPLSQGSAAPATGIFSNGADLNTIFCALGTNSLMPGIQGLSMSTAVQLPSGSGSATSNLNILTSGWQFTGNAIGGTQTLGNLPNPSSGIANPLPPGATQVQITATLTSATAGTISNTASSITAIPSSGGVGFQVASIGAGGSGSGFVSNYQLVIKFYNASTQLISTTTCNLIASRGP